MCHAERKRRCEEKRKAGSLCVHPSEEGPAQSQVPSALPVWSGTWFTQECEAQTCLLLFIRKRAKLQGHFKGMVKGAQKGALSGKRMQKRKRKAWKKKCSRHCLDSKCMCAGAFTRISSLRILVCMCVLRSSKAGSAFMDIDGTKGNSFGCHLNRNRLSVICLHQIKVSINVKSIYVYTMDFISCKFFFPFNPRLCSFFFFFFVPLRQPFRADKLSSCRGGVNIPLGLYDSCVAAHCGEMSHDMTRWPPNCALLCLSSAVSQLLRRGSRSCQQHGV